MWESIIEENLLQWSRDIKNGNILYFCPNEYETTAVATALLIAIQQALEISNTELHFVFGSWKPYIYITPYANMKMYQWPFFWLTSGFYRSVPIEESLDNIATRKIKYLMGALNNNPHPWRLVFMVECARLNLLDNNKTIVSWSSTASYTMQQI